MDRETEQGKRWLADWAAEKKLIACDLHDGLIQWLVGSSLQLDSIELEKEIPGDSTRNKIRNVNAYLKEAIQQARDLIQNLSAATVEIGCLPDEIAAWVERCQQADLEVELVLDDRMSTVEPLLGGSIYHIIREALWNVIQHSKASRAHVSGKMENGCWSLVILDNGIGIPAELEQSDGMGIRGIRTRAALFGGELAILSSEISSAEFRKVVDHFRSSSSADVPKDEFFTGTCLTIQLREPT